MGGGYLAGDQSGTNIIWECHLLPKPYEIRLNGGGDLMSQMFCCQTYWHKAFYQSRPSEAREALVALLSPAWRCLCLIAAHMADCLWF